MRTKVKLAFLILGLVLSVAGATSYIELTRLTKSVEEVIDNGAKSVSLSKGVLDIIQKYNFKIMKFTDTKDSSNVTFTLDDTKLIDSLLYNARLLYPESVKFNDVMESRNRYFFAIESINHNKATLKLHSEQFADYFAEYSSFSNYVKEYMILSQQHVVKETSKLRGEIYRSSMQSVMALSVSVVILLVFYFMISIFYIRPISSMTKSLSKYIQSGTTFDVKVEGNDEPKRLKELILHLIRQIKDKQ